MSHKAGSQLLGEHQAASQREKPAVSQAASDLLSNTSFWVFFGVKGKLSLSVLPLAGHQQTLLALCASQFSQNS